MKTVKIAMLGSGFVADFYMLGLRDVNGQQVVVNYSRKRRRAHDFAKIWNIPEHTTSLKKIIARDDIDLFLIALPNEEHESTAIALAKARRNQVCTKPLARDRREAKSMLTATPALPKAPVNALAVNWTPWSVLNTSGRFPPKASSSISRQNEPSRVFDSRQPTTNRLCQSITAAKYMNPRGIGT